MVAFMSSELDCIFMCPVYQNLKNPVMCEMVKVRVETVQCKGGRRWESGSMRTVYTPSLTLYSSLLLGLPIKIQLIMFRNQSCSNNSVETSYVF